MLVYPQAIMMAGGGAVFGSDYPALKAGDAIAQACVWMARPDLFSKDTAQAEGVLFGGATRTANGLQVPNNSSAGAAWPRSASFSSFDPRAGFSVVWQGKPSSFNAGGRLISVQRNTEAWSDGQDALSFGRSGSGDSLKMLTRTEAGQELSLSSGSGALQTSANTIQYAATWDGSTLKMYRGGTEIHSGGGFWSLLPGTGPVTICNRTVNDPGEGVQAADVTLAGIFDRALSPQELQTLATAPNSILSVATAQGPDFSSADYPVLSTTNAIAQSTLWLADSTRFLKDSREASVVLSGDATFTAGTGIASSSVWGNHASWPQGDLSRIQSQAAYTFWVDFNSAWNSQAWAILFQIANPENNAYYIQRSGSTNNLRAMHLGIQAAFSGGVQSGSQTLAQTWDGTTARLYRNGTLISSTSATRGAGPLNDGSIQVFSGLEGTFRRGFICDRALSAGEISSVHSNFGQLLLNP